MFKKLLIANRGEIACRIARTARRMGIRVTSVFSQADEDALHKEIADEGWFLGSGPVAANYLNTEKIITAARECGADAIHPGYGFLSESGDFAEQCRRAGLIFVGPTPETMRLVGAKFSARNLAKRIGVPVLPGYDGETQDTHIFKTAAERIGYPVMVKASAGGGGRGMRVVWHSNDLAGAIESATREAKAAFGDGRMLLEKYLERPRHVELQILADVFGEIAIFPERDCSLQRNHQKIVEETPAPRLSSDLAETLRDAARKIARASDYLGAGTVEFLLSADEFYFLEVNARLQVEHPITEMVAGIDLVEWQLRVACGERLPITQEKLQYRGWAIEARLCAEDPEQDFRPDFGKITHLRFPTELPGLRIESGYREGDTVSTNYDSLLAKVVVWDETREGAVFKMQNALSRTEIVGISSNLAFLREATSNDLFVSGDHDTNTVEEMVSRTALSAPSDTFLFAAAVAFRLGTVRERERVFAEKIGESGSPWATGDGWRLYERKPITLSLRIEGKTLTGAISNILETDFDFEMNGISTAVRAIRSADRIRLRLGLLEKEFRVVTSTNGGVIIVEGCNFPFQWIDPLKTASSSQSDDLSLRTPLPARVARIFVKAGDVVQKGATLLLLEAMKMEIPVTAGRDGVIEDIFCVEGDAVQEGEEIIIMAEQP